MKKIILFFALLSAVAMNGQDTRFSQFYNNPLRLNPALTGVFEGSSRAMISYRSQGAKFFDSGAPAYTTYSAGGDFRLLGPKHDNWGIGGLFVGDRVGTAKWKQMEGHLSATYQKMLGKPRGWKLASTFLIAGANLGFGQRGIDWKAIRTSEQFNGDGFDPSLPSGETAVAGNKTFMDFGAGLLYYTVYSERKSYYMGAAITHLNQPDVTLFSNGEDKIYTRWTIHGGGEILLSPYKKGGNAPLSLVPALIVMGQGSSLEANVGTAFKYRKNRNDDFSMRFGGFLRLVNDSKKAAPTTESLIINTGLELGNFQLGISYDATLSTAKRGNDGQGAFEVSLMYINRNRGKKQQGCPTW